FFRDLLSEALKVNAYLEKGVLTGILRVAKESIFSGLNNFEVSTVLTGSDYQDKFGFTIPEVRQMLLDYDMNGKEWLEIEDWYNGYRFGNETVFNPWSILNYLKTPSDGTQPYWVNTSDNAILKRLFFGKKANIEAHLESLLRGEKITVAVNDNVAFQDLDTNKNTVWSLLLSSGYLKHENRHRAPESEHTTWQLSIPNREVRYVFKEIILRWLQSDLQNNDHDQMLEHLTRGELKPFEKYFRSFVEQVFSYYDVQRGLAENFYHAFFLGLFAKLEPWYVILSNREAGYGRYDICLIPRQPGKKGVVIEIKTPDPEAGETLQSAIAAAEAQMQQKKYDTQLAAQGIGDVFRLAIAVMGKQFLVKQV
ncbi:MAG: AAA family ATPase, partial [Bacteroidota bacterium]